MMKKILILTISLLTFNTICIAQDEPNTIDNQFTVLLKESNNFQTFKVVPKSKLELLQRNVHDSIKKLQKEIESNKILVDTQKFSLDSISNRLQTTQSELETALKNEDNIQVLGIYTHKSAFKTVVWIIIAVLLLSLGILYYRFRKSHFDTKEAHNKLAETELEFEESRRLSIEREQKIRRQLQDEINKNRNV